MKFWHHRAGALRFGRTNLARPERHVQRWQSSCALVFGRRLPKTRGVSGQPCSPARVSEWLRAQCAPDQGAFGQDSGLRPRQVGPAFRPGSIVAAPLVSASRALHGTSFVCLRVLRPHARARPCVIHCRAVSRDRKKASKGPEILQRSPRAKLHSRVAQRFEGHSGSVRVTPTQDWRRSGSNQTKSNALSTVPRTEGLFRGIDAFEGPLEGATVRYAPCLEERSE